MDAEDWLPWLGIGLLASFAIAIKAMFRSRRTADALRDLREKINLLEDRLLRFDERLQAARPAPAPEMPRADIAAPQAQEHISEPQQPAAEPPETPEPPAASTPVPGPATVRDGRRLEQLIVENWLVWLGGVALALGGAFLVKLSIDYGWLTPAVRVVLGVALGFFLSGAAEWVVRRDTPLEGEGARPSYIPQTLAAAGCATVFASLYAAYQLYALLPSFLAFPLLATTAAATVALSCAMGHSWPRSVLSALSPCRCWCKATRRAPSHCSRILPWSVPAPWPCCNIVRGPGSPGSGLAARSSGYCCGWRPRSARRRRWSADFC